MTPRTIDIAYDDFSKQSPLNIEPTIKGAENIMAQFSGGSTKLDDLKDKQIRAAVDTQLAAKGLTKAAGEDADVFVAYQGAIDELRISSAAREGFPVTTGR